jgi:serine protease Do
MLARSFPFGPPLAAAFLALALATGPLPAAEDDAPPRLLSVEEIVKTSRPSIVTVTHRGRSGRTQGLGTGFVISEDGLIATNLHVIGEARPIDVEFSNGKTLPVVEVYAWDRRLDLAIIRVKADQLTPLPLGDSDTVEQGAEIVALGNPQGLKYSVVKGIVSAIRNLNDDKGTGLIQVAMPIEPGNSGGPLVNLYGEVYGIITFKEAYSDNVGFAMPVNFIKTLIETPNQVPMDRWVTIGALNKDQWKTVNGGLWSQRAGIISAASDYGHGFGGRALCLSRQKVPKVPYELAVDTRIHHDDGAAGLTFASDGDQIHYGFYASSGQLRLTRFDGADVYSWTVLEQVESDAYLPGEWNDLRVRVEKDRILCFVNGEKVIESTDTALRDGRVGLCKFRHTHADYRKFRTGKDIAPGEVPTAVVASLKKLIQSREIAGSGDEILALALAKHPGPSQEILSEEAEALERQATALRSLARDVHAVSVLEDVLEIAPADKADDEIDLFHAGLLIAKLENPDLDVAVYLEELDRMSTELSERFSCSTPDTEKLEDLSTYLFEEQGFHGSRSNYYHRSNSFLNEVLDDREGLPISLAVVYIELAHRLGLKNVSGVGLPGHFIVQNNPDHGKRLLIDVFDGGKMLTRPEVEELVFSLTGTELLPSDLQPATKRSILLRLLNNLIGLELGDSIPARALPYLNIYLALAPESPGQRLSRAIIHFQSDDHPSARIDLEWLLENEPDGMNLDRLERLYQRLDDEPSKKPKT